jgi:hypothetical protein
MKILLKKKGRCDYSCNCLMLNWISVHFRGGAVGEECVLVFVVYKVSKRLEDALAGHQLLCYHAGDADHRQAAVLELLGAHGVEVFRRSGS